MGPIADDNGWAEYKQLVLGAISELKAEARDTRKEMALFREELARLTTRMALLMTVLTAAATAAMKYL